MSEKETKRGELWRYITVKPEILKMIVDLGAFSIEEIKRKGIPPDIIYILYEQELITYDGKFYEINPQKIQETIGKYRQTALYRFAIWIHPVKNMRRRIEL